MDTTRVDQPRRGQSVRELAAHLRVSPNKVLRWIKNGSLKAVNTSQTRCGRPRYVILPHHLDEFVAANLAAAADKPAPRRRRLPVGAVDYFPEVTTPTPVTSR